MTYLSRIEADLTSAMRERRPDELSVLRMLKSALHNEKIAKRVDALADDQALKVLQTEAKRRRESIEAFTAGNRADLAAQEQRELAIIERYLPEQLGEDQVRTVVKKVVAQAGESAQFGKVMKTAMGELQGKADGKLVSQIVKEELAK